MDDIGNLHVIDWYLWNASRFQENAILYGTAFQIDGRTIDTIDFDIETEKREGWAYD